MTLWTDQEQERYQWPLPWPIRALPFRSVSLRRFHPQKSQHIQNAPAFTDLIIYSATRTGNLSSILIWVHTSGQALLACSYGGCAKAGEFQSTLEAGVTDRTPGYFKAIVGPSGKIPKVNITRYHLKAPAYLWQHSSYLACTQAERKLCFQAVNRCSFWAIKAGDILTQCSLEN